eukprot:6199356-Pleurochrysis_carterae.AAC.3
MSTRARARAQTAVLQSAALRAKVEVSLRQQRGRAQRSMLGARTCCMASRRACESAAALPAAASAAPPSRGLRCDGAPAAGGRRPPPQTRPARRARTPRAQASAPAPTEKARESPACEKQHGHPRAQYPPVRPHLNDSHP